MITAEQDVEAYKEVLDIMAARIKRAEQHNSYLSEALFECQKRVERLNAELEKCARKSIPALAPNTPSDDLPNDNP
jgi:predicted RNase H-like nuclease (RuvC/YqgF family)